ncbi:MAG: hypothetical protein R3Y65_08580 [Bacillota bacterium]
MKYILIADILGFSNLISNNEHADKILDKWVSSITKIKNDVEITLLSDTIFAVSDSLSKVIKYANAILEIGAKDAIPIRGAITHGEVANNKLIYGKAVIMAHKLEMNQNWMGIMIDNEAIPEQYCKQHVNSGLVLKYLVPVKEGKDIISYVVNWNVRDVDALHMVFNKHNSNLKNNVKILNLFYNTLDFFIYKKFINKLNKIPTEYIYYKENLNRISAYFDCVLTKLDNDLLCEIIKEGQ